MRSLRFRETHERANELAAGPTPVPETGVVYIAVPEHHFALFRHWMSRNGFGRQDSSHSMNKGNLPMNSPVLALMTGAHRPLVPTEHSSE